MLKVQVERFRVVLGAGRPRSIGIMRNFDPVGGDYWLINWRGHVAEGGRFRDALSILRMGGVEAVTPAAEEAPGAAPVNDRAPATSWPQVQFAVLDSPGEKIPVAIDGRPGAVQRVPTTAAYLKPGTLKNVGPSEVGSGDWWTEGCQMWGDEWSIVWPPGTRNVALGTAEDRRDFPPRWTSEQHPSPVTLNAHILGIVVQPPPKASAPGVTVEDLNTPLQDRITSAVDREYRVQFGEERGRYLF